MNTISLVDWHGRMVRKLYQDKVIVPDAEKKRWVVEKRVSFSSRDEAREFLQIPLTEEGLEIFARFVKVENITKWDEEWIVDVNKIIKEVGGDFLSSVSKWDEEFVKEADEKKRRDTAEKQIKDEEKKRYLLTSLKKLITSDEWLRVVCHKLYLEQFIDYDIATKRWVSTIVSEYILRAKTKTRWREFLSLGMSKKDTTILNLFVRETDIKRAKWLFDLSGILLLIEGRFSENLQQWNEQRTKKLEMEKKRREEEQQRERKNGKDAEEEQIQIERQRWLDASSSPWEEEYVYPVDFLTLPSVPLKIAVKELELINRKVIENKRDEGIASEENTLTIVLEKLTLRVRGTMPRDDFSFRKSPVVLLKEDLREFVNELQKKGAIVKFHDPAVSEEHGEMVKATVPFSFECSSRTDVKATGKTSYYQTSIYSSIYYLDISVTITLIHAGKDYFINVSSQKDKYPQSKPILKVWDCLRALPSPLPPLREMDLHKELPDDRPGIGLYVSFSGVKGEKPRKLKDTYHYLVDDKLQKWIYEENATEPCPFCQKMMRNPFVGLSPRFKEKRDQRNLVRAEEKFTVRETFDLWTCYCPHCDGKIFEKRSSLEKIYCGKKDEILYPHNWQIPEVRVTYFEDKALRINIRPTEVDEKSIEKMALLTTLVHSFLADHLSSKGRVEQITPRDEERQIPKGKEGGLPRIDYLFPGVGGYEKLKHKLRDHVLLPIKYPELFEKIGVRSCRGVLLYGPPGCGKTYTIKQMCEHAGIGDPKIITLKELNSKWVGESEEKLGKMIDEIYAAGTRVVILDEIDSIASRRDEHQSRKYRNLTSMLLNFMDGFRKKGDVVVVGTTNHPELIDPALRRPGRFDLEEYVALPDEKTREEIFRKIVQRNATAIHEEVDFRKLARDTGHFTGSFIEEAIRAAGTKAVLRHIESNTQSPLIIMQTDLLLTIEEYKKRAESSYYEWQQKWESYADEPQGNGLRKRDNSLYS